jgi:hypothetical protein
MTTSANDIGLSEPTGSERVPPGTLGYFQSRNRHNVYDLVMSEFEDSGLSQADLARRLGKGPDQVCRLIGGPGNWTLDTLSDLMFAISGTAPAYSKEYPLRQPRRNRRGPSWLYDDELIVFERPRPPQTASSSEEVKIDPPSIGVTKGLA